MLSAINTQNPALFNNSVLSPTVAAAANAAKQASTTAYNAIGQQDNGQVVASANTGNLSFTGVDGDTVSISDAARSQNPMAADHTAAPEFTSMGPRVSRSWSAVQFATLAEQTITAMAAQAA